MKHKTTNRSKSNSALILPAEMFRFVTGSTQYKTFHKGISDPKSQSLLYRFLNASLDEVRLYHADSYANLVLTLTDLDDAKHFRQGVLRREAARDIEYQKQRDHAAHTLHNYLLGWYIYEKNDVLRNEMCRAIDLRFPPIKDHGSDYQAERFGDLWPYVSLLHDVGYLFEGGLEVLRAGSHSDHVQCGAEIAEEYFRNRFWIETPLAAATERDRVRRWTGITEPDFAPYTVTAVGDSLRSLGNLETLWSCVRTEFKARRMDTKRIAAVDLKGQGDAFNVWRQHYRVYSPRMEKRVIQMQTAFYAVMWDGAPGVGVRMLDHGVAGGLLLLLYATYYFQMHYGIMAQAKDPKCDQEIRDLEKRITERIKLNGLVYNAYWWWTSAVWATAATALHNFQQIEPPWPGCQDAIKPLAIREDPLAYLGILVDVLQEWDRYTISRTSIFTGELPLQGKDMKLWTSKGLIHLDYGDFKRAKKVTASLTTALKGWKKVVTILPAS
jgi:hypothetical protein